MFGNDVDAFCKWSIDHRECGAQSVISMLLKHIQAQCNLQIRWWWCAAHVCIWENRRFFDTSHSSRGFKCTMLVVIDFPYSKKKNTHKHIRVSFRILRKQTTFDSLCQHVQKFLYKRFSFFYLFTLDSSFDGITIT